MKIYLVAGAVLLFVFLLGAWIFIVDFGNLAGDLGKGAENLAINEKTKFVGIWETNYIEGDSRFVGYNGIYKFNSDNTGTISGLSCTWDIDDNQLIVHYFGGVRTITYEYDFLDDNTLILSNSDGILDFIKH